MRTSLSRVATTVMVGLLVTGCGSATSPTPGTTPSPSGLVASPTPPASAAPASSPGSGGPSIIAIAAGASHSCAVTSDGRVRCWGGNGAGQLGDGTTSDSSTPVDVIGLASGITAISAGGSHMCALTTAGGVTCWGGNDFGGLGDGTEIPSSTPLHVVGLASGVTAISAGLIHTCALTSHGGVKCWGYNGFGGLGHGTRAESRIPVDVSGLTSGVQAIAAGNEHACALTTSGGVKCWGSRTGAELGNGSTTHSTIPVDVTGLASGVTAIAAGPEFTCAVAGDDGVVCWGREYGSTPVAVIDPARRLSAVAAGGSHACGLEGAGGVICWGANYHGQLGDGSTTETDEPVDVSGLVTGVAAIAAGYDHTCALTVDDRVLCWGDNWYGQLGDQTPCRGMSSSAVPVEVDLAPRSAIGGPTDAPIGRVEYATGPTDVILRLDSGPDLGVGELEGELFQPGPEFTLYGDGTVLFRNDRAERPPVDGPIVRARPFTLAHLTDEQIQVLLQFAVGEGGLAEACHQYESRDTDGFGSVVITVRSDALAKRVNVGGLNPLGALVERLAEYDPGPSVSTRTWTGDRYWGNLFEASSAIEIGLLPDPDEIGIFQWPWPSITPAEFVGRDEGGWIGNPRRVMSSAEAAVLGLSNYGGVVQRVYLLGPDGVTIYSFSLWPMLPDEMG